MLNLLQHGGRPVLVLALALGSGACASGGRTGTAQPGDTVAVGYGSQAQGEVTGAVSHVGGEGLDTRGISTMDQLLERMPGVQIVGRTGTSFHVRIRGTRSVLASEDPLLIIDGTPVQPANFAQAIGGLAPRDVASIDVMRDASAAIYGVRGANGVILIQTKRAND